MIAEIKGGRPTSALSKRSSPLIQEKTIKSRPKSAVKRIATPVESSESVSPFKPDVLGKPKRADLRSLKKAPEDASPSTRDESGCTGGSNTALPVSRPTRSTMPAEVEE